MASSAQLSRSNGPRKAILDLAPLELECLNTLWPLGEGTVRQIRQLLALSRPRAYTTIMTIMDRLAHKGVVTRHKVGRAYLYRPNLTAEEARARAVERVVAGFFDGSAEALAAHLAGGLQTPVRAGARRAPTGVAPTAPPVPAQAVNQQGEASEVFPTTHLDESLL
jgi:BlaI family penicillinase repressor